MDSSSHRAAVFNTLIETVKKEREALKKDLMKDNQQPVASKEPLAANALEAYYVNKKDLAATALEAYYVKLADSTRALWPQIEQSLPNSLESLFLQYYRFNICTVKKALSDYQTFIDSLPPDLATSPQGPLESKNSIHNLLKTTNLLAITINAWLASIWDRNSANFFHLALGQGTEGIITDGLSKLRSEQYNDLLSQLITENLPRKENDETMIFCIIEDLVTSQLISIEQAKAILKALRPCPKPQTQEQQKANLQWIKLLDKWLPQNLLTPHLPDSEEDIFYFISLIKATSFVVDENSGTPTLAQAVGILPRQFKLDRLHRTTSTVSMSTEQAVLVRRLTENAILASTLDDTESTRSHLADRFILQKQKSTALGNAHFSTSFDNHQIAKQRSHQAKLSDEKHAESSLALSRKEAEEKLRALHKSRKSGISTQSSPLSQHDTETSFSSTTSLSDVTTDHSDQQKLLLLSSHTPSKQPGGYNASFQETYDDYEEEEKSTPPTGENSNHKMVNEVHKKLLDLCRDYLKDNRGQIKKCIFDMFTEALTKNINNPNVEMSTVKLKNINMFELLLSKEDNRLREHRTPAWERFVYNCLSLITLIPLIVRAASSYYHYHTLCFWKPASERVVTEMHRQINKLGQLKLSLLQ